MSFSSKQYAWKNISLNILGTTIDGVSEIEYGKITEKEFIFGAGNKPQGIQSGNETIEGKLTLYQSVITALETVAKAANGSVADLVFDIIVSYNDGLTVTTDRIKFAEVKGYKKGMKQNDKKMEVPLDFMALDIEYGI